MHETGLRNRHANEGGPPPGTALLHHPWYWWGPLGAPHDPPGLDRLIAAGSLSAPVAAVLAAAVHAGASVAAVALPSGAGKTTLLSALSPALPPGRAPFHLRGGYEDFAAFGEHGETPATAALLVNELSDHLPIYLWGEGIARLASLRERGFQVLATAHATDAADLSRLLEGAGAGLAPGAGAAMFDLVARVEPVARVLAIEVPERGHAATPRALPGSSERAGVLDWLRAASAANPALCAIDPDSLPAWERWAMTQQPPAPPADRPGAMLALRERERGRRNASP